MLRSTLAVVAGLATLAAASFAIEGAVNAFVGSATLNQSAWFGALTTAYTLVCVAAGGYVAGWVARRTEVRHALVMGAIQLLFTFGAMLQLRERGPLAAWVVGLMSIVPSACLGGMIRERTRS